MSLSVATNVLRNQSTESASRSMNPFEASNMLSGCRDMAADILTRSLSGMLDKIESSLFDLAEKCTDRETANLYMQARGEAQQKRVEIEREFRRQFIDGFNRTLRGEANSKKFKALDADSLELSLVDDGDYEESLAITNMASRLSSSAGDELGALNQRIGMLMQLPESDAEDNPLSPKAICEAFRSACMQLESGLNVRLIVLKQFEQTLDQNVGDMYQSVNQFLINKNILPVLPKRPKASKATGGFTPARPQAEAPDVLSPSAASLANQVGSDGDLFAALQQLLGASGGLRQASQPVGTGAVSSADLASLGLHEVAGNEPVAVSRPPQLAGQSVLDALNMVQQGKLEMIFPGQTPVAIAAQPNILHNLKSSSLASSLGQLDEMTIDIVAMLFDYIFDDEAIPGAMKALIGRLQIPVLKVAMLDTKFFSRKQHPTRKLLDALARLASEWRETDGLEHKAYRQVASVVDRVVHEFDENIGLFEEVLGDIEAYNAEEDRLAAEAAERAAEALMQREIEDLASLQVGQQIRSRLDPSLPDVINRFLESLWQPVLLATLLQKGESSPEWQQAVQVMDDLIWSVQPKTGVEDRMKLVNLLPSMLKQLETGTGLLDGRQDERKAFFSELVHCHAAAIKSGAKMAAQPVQAADSRADKAAPPVVVENTAANVVPLRPDIPVLDMEVQPAAPERVDPQLPSGQDERLVRGAQVEVLQSNGSWLRCKLAWISPMRSRFLFANRQDSSTLALEAAELNDWLDTGRLRFVAEEAPIVDRAVSNMLDMLQQSQAEAS